MSFSYDHSLEKWQRAVTESNARIRILELYPSRDADANLLHGTLAWVPLSLTTSIPRDETGNDTSQQPLNDFSYKALSYTWGNGSLTHSITVNGASLKITRSLFDALSHLQPSTHPLKIWIDQICINQQDSKEKEEQVSLMERIYRTSEETLVWLGPSANGSDGLLDFFARIGTFAETHNMLVYWTKARRAEFFAITSKSDPNDAMTKEYHAFCKATAQSFQREYLDALIAFYKRPWFSRAWVIQEFSLPPRVTLLCGHKTIPAETLMMALQIFESTIFPLVLNKLSADQDIVTCWHEIMELSAIQPFFSSRQRRKARDEGRIKGDTLFHILYRLYVEKDVTATQPCDMIYGVLGLVVDAKELGITVDYSAGDPNRQADLAFTKVARAIVASGKVDLLSLSQHPEENEEKNRGVKLPSWVPDWRAKIRRSFAWLSDEYRPPLFNASSGKDVVIYPLDKDNDDITDEDLLSLAGYTVDTLETLSPTPWSDGSPARTNGTYEIPHAEYIALLAQIHHLCSLSTAKNFPIYPTAARRAEAAWRIPVGDLDEDVSSMTRRTSETQTCRARYVDCLRELATHIKAEGMSTVASTTSTAREAYARSRAELETLLAQDLPTAATTSLIKGLHNPNGGSGGSIYRLYMRQMGGKRPFLSRMGYVGMAPSWAEPGDMIVVLLGASVPFIVRPLRENRYKFLGECYCDGIMDGEIMESMQEEKIVLV
ncbi:HET-domain-containing protein [Paraphaeosphaeria sporulosa]|uniref:HET-domain-containing protein n=1 Tax=Paraphaeosphaeria sporulosa TaxID=1460663 RepID=A0A177C1F0_9PLEO|nr:HET-domain-containing protein [Paraphaeosphaeria sporulosa]OAG00709.1 HET-domain-containing protein [Paraphaeosphaeria sporulosa]